MDSQDLQDAQRLHEELSRKIIGRSFEVINELGAGFLESVYEKALHIALTESGLAVQRQKPLEVCLR